MRSALMRVRTDARLSFSMVVASMPRTIPETPGYRHVVERGACASHDAIQRGAGFGTMTTANKNPGMNAGALRCHWVHPPATINRW